LEQLGAVPQFFEKSELFSRQKFRNCAAVVAFLVQLTLQIEIRAEQAQPLVRRKPGENALVLAVAFKLVVRVHV